ncbi:Transcriptional regulator with XRE-family HTH domain [Hyphomicrobiales bacterium]|nr:Transcriptional regulator with XRE-family HTH domain [Hyphomicrobiales bacterium]
MSPMAHIRKSVFGVSQAHFAAIAGVSQATVSRWERFEWEPNRDELARIREEAMRRGIKWSDALFFQNTLRDEAA